MSPNIRRTARHRLRCSPDLRAWSARRNFPGCPMTGFPRDNRALGTSAPAAMIEPSPTRTPSAHPLSQCQLSARFDRAACRMSMADRYLIAQHERMRVLHHVVSTEAVLNVFVRAPMRIPSFTSPRITTQWPPLESSAVSRRRR